MQAFFDSTAGKVVVIAVIIVLLLLIMRGGKNEKKTDIRALTVSALMIALATVLGMIKILEMPQGGAVTLFSILPIALCAYLLGTRRGVMAGFCVGLINLILGPYVIHPVQLLMDYPIAFGAVGLAGVHIVDALRDPFARPAVLVHDTDIGAELRHAGNRRGREIERDGDLPCRRETELRGAGAEGGSGSPKCGEGVHAVVGACDGDLDLKAVDTGENGIVESRNRMHKSSKCSV